MNIETANKLCQLNNDFYRDNGEAFFATRQSAWSGWKRCLDLIKLPQNPLILDLACGNLRFEKFMGNVGNGTFYAVDNCDAPVKLAKSVYYQKLDIIEAIKTLNRKSAQHGGQLTNNFSESLLAPACDLTVLFGFMHHLPLIEWRQAILATLVEQTKLGGYIIVTFWQFLNNIDMAKKAHETTTYVTQAIQATKATKATQAQPALDIEQLDAGDYILGFSNIPGAYRYCHSFSDGEIDQLINTLKSDYDCINVVDRFNADGRDNTLNAYLILQKS